MTTDPDPDSAFPMIGIFMLILFLVATVILSIGDEAFSALGESRIRELEQDGDRRAARIRRMIAHPRRFSERVRVGQWLFAALIMATAVTMPTVKALASWMQSHFHLSAVFPVSTLTALLLSGIAAAAVTAIIGDRIPRRLAAKNPEKSALGIAGAFSVVYACLLPLDFLCHAIAVPFLLLFRADPHDDLDAVTEDDIREMMDAGEETGAIEGTQKDMVNNIFEFDDITAAEIMTPRTDVVAIEADDPVSDAIRAGVENGYSRIPVYEDDIDHVIGILYIKDLLPYVGTALPADVTIRSLLRETHFVPDTKKCDDLFEEMNEKHLQMAIVVDEYGGVAGIVTIEDLLESIVGNMQDEFDNEEEEITQVSEHTFVVDGSLSISDFDEQLQIALPEGDYDTVAGFLMDRLGHIPEEEENATVVFENITFTIRSMDDRRIEQVLVEIAPPAEENDR